MFSAKVSDINLPRVAINCLIRSGLKELNPPQLAALDKGVLDRKNLVVASPTASGKTLIAELAFLKNFSEGAGKCVYIVPLKALASEKYNDFTKKYNTIGMKIAISIGDYDSAEDWLGGYDLIICTSEKLDSLMRHDAKWVKDVSLIIADEIHLMNDVSRGPTLEVVITRLRHLNPKLHIVALSATIQNAEELGKWLGADVIRSDYRPIKLKRGVYHPTIVEFAESDEPIVIDTERILPGEILLAEHTVQLGKQALVFVSTRRSAEATAEKIANHISRYISTKSEEKQQLAELAKKIAKALPRPTKQCIRLAHVVENGAAFHHAGLVAKQRGLIEDAFRSGLLKIITSTPTLAYGMNLPAFRTLIRDSKRYSGFGNEYIPVLEVHQMMGRAGRSDRDTHGEAVLIAKSEEEARELKKHYIDGEPEPIYSKLSVEPVLRMHVLSLIASDVCNDEKSLLDFFAKTFFGYQYKSVEGIMNKVSRILAELKKYGFLDIKDESFISGEFTPAFNLYGSNRKLTATPIGKRVAQLYIDPVTAFNLLTRLSSMKTEPTDLAVLDMISDCSELVPHLSVKTKEYVDIQDSLEKYRDLLIRKTPEIWDYDYDDFLNTFKSTMLFNDWINEMSEDKILDKYGLPPGVLYQKMTNAEWLLYAASELAKMSSLQQSYLSAINRAKLRLKHGVKEELLLLVSLKGIGRARGRRLWKAGIKTPADIKSASAEQLAKVLGPAIAQKLKEEVE